MRLKVGKPPKLQDTTGGAHYRWRLGALPFAALAYNGRAAGLRGAADQFEMAMGSQNSPQSALAVSTGYEPLLGYSQSGFETSTTPNSDAREFTGPSERSGSDWVLVLSDTARNFAIPGKPR